MWILAHSLHFLATVAPIAEALHPQISAASPKGEYKDFKVPGTIPEHYGLLAQGRVILKGLESNTWSRIQQW